MSQTSTTPPRESRTASTKASNEKLSNEIDEAIARLKKAENKRVSEKEQIEKGIDRAKRGPQVETLSLKEQKIPPSKLEQLAGEQKEEGVKDIFELSAEMNQHGQKMGLSFQDLVAQYTASQEVGATSAQASLSALVEKVVLTMSYIRSKDLQQCKVTLKNPPIFDGAQLNVKIVANKCSVEFLNLSDKALELLSENKMHLENTLSEKVSSMQIENIQFHKRSEALAQESTEQAFQQQQQDDENKDSQQRRQKKQKQKQLF